MRTERIVVAEVYPDGARVLRAVEVPAEEAPDDPAPEELDPVPAPRETFPAAGSRGRKRDMRQEAIFDAARRRAMAIVGMRTALRIDGRPWSREDAEREIERQEREP